MSKFPQMIFHIVEPAMTVDSQEELDKYLSQGWSMTSVEFDYVKMIKAKIAYHESEIARLSEKIAPEDEEFICDCGYEAKSNAGLAAHKRSHKEANV